MRAPLYHAISFEHFVDVMRNDALRGHSTHRLHSNGTVPWPNPFHSENRFPPAYLDSDWYYGICLTRDERFALSWNDLVLELDQDQLRTRHRVVPYNWMETRVKAEAEEYLVTGKAGIKCKDALIAHKDNSRTRRNARRLTSKQHVGEVPRISRFIRSIHVVASEQHRKKTTFAMKPEAEASLAQWRYEKFCEALPLLNGYCRWHNIPLVVR